jgi:hypothetical protein
VSARDDTTDQTTDDTAAATRRADTGHDDDTPGRAANPNAESAHGLAGDMGISSERTHPFGSDSIEGTGTVGSARGHTDGEVETHPGQVEPSDEVHRQEQDVEENTASLPSHDHLREANPRPTRSDTPDDDTQDDAGRT